MPRKTSFFETWSWFKFNNLGLGLGKNLTFYNSVAKELKLKVRKSPTPILNRVNCVRENFELTSLCKLIRFTSKIKTIYCRLDIKHIFTNLNDTWQSVCLSLSFIVKVTFQYHGGIDFGKAVNKPHPLVIKY